jgi:cell pole-organizing protein PopZ
MLPAAATDAGLDRPMEDAVADLLRPLLKTWLAENMPKIVERALRREMSERLLPGQKSQKE